MSVACAVSSFTTPILFGAEIQSLTANLVTGYSTTVDEIYWYNHPTTVVSNATFCNVTVSYTHPGQEDYITVTTWLPQTWNERLQAVGGGGWVAGGESFFLSNTAMSGAIGNGYASITTDAGLKPSAQLGAELWALESEGNVNLYNLQNLGSVSLNDEAVIGKSLIKDYYGKAPKYSYWSGCSQGGRQGLMMAQRYPTQYDGIAAAAPAINWNAFFTAVYWPQLIMRLADQYPKPCELDQITATAVSACDGLDNVTDGVITKIKECNFDPFSIVGTTFNCSTTGKITQVSQMAAEVANATWGGPQTVNGGFLWYGPNMGADLSGTLTGQSIATTTCSSNGTCVGSPSSLGTQWISLFIEKNPNFNLANITHEQYDKIFHAGYQQFSSIIDTSDPDLSGFSAHGGKMITYHGLSDQIIPAKGTEKYYNEATALDANIKDFYRYFEAPGVQHCSGGNGGLPTSTFAALVAWVEKGTAPATLPVHHVHKGTVYNQILCPYPSVSVYDESGDPTSADSYSCS